MANYFNPRSREGSDQRPGPLGHTARNFNPRSREGSDVINIGTFYLMGQFQSTLPRRERR